MNSIVKYLMKYIHIERCKRSTILRHQQKYKLTEKSLLKRWKIQVRIKLIHCNITFFWFCILLYNTHISVLITRLIPDPLSHIEGSHISIPSYKYMFIHTLPSIHMYIFSHTYPDIVIFNLCYHVNLSFKNIDVIFLSY